MSTLALLSNDCICGYVILDCNKNNSSSDNEYLQDKLTTDFDFPELLQGLEIRNCNITDVPQNLNHVVHTISIAGNVNLGGKNPDFDISSDLTESILAINASNTGIVKIAKRLVFSNYYFRAIDLSHNNISSIDTTIQKKIVEKFSYFYLHRNPICQNPESMTFTRWRV